MMCEAYFGAIKDNMMNNWKHGNDSPYDVLDSSVNLLGKGHELLQQGDAYFTDRIQLDWGSFAWKCKEQDVLNFLCDNYSKLPWLQEGEKRLIEEVKQYVKKHGNIVYGIVFIEVY